MCGLFAAIGDNIYPTLVEIGIKKANTRGPHGCGFVVWFHTNTHGHLKRFVGLPEDHRKEIIKQLFEYSSYYKPVAVLYHARLATTGNYDLKMNLQPFDYYGTYSIHNGNIYNYEHWRSWLENKFEWQARSQVDSEVIPALFSIRRNIGGLSFQEAIDELGEEVFGDHSAAIVSDGIGLSYWSKGLPLYRYDVDGTVYLCSRGIEILENKKNKGEFKNYGEVVTAKRN